MMRRAPLWIGALVLAVVVAGLALGQGSDGTGTGSGGGASGGPAGNAGATGGTVTIAGQPASVTRGKQLYAANCQTCHGADGKGGKYRGVGSEAARRGFASFKSLILYGRERMPGYAKTGLSTSDSLGKLGANGYLGNSQAPTDQQVRDLLAYLETLPRRGERGFFGGDD